MGALLFRRSKALRVQGAMQSKSKMLLTDIVLKMLFCQKMNFKLQSNIFRQKYSTKILGIESSCDDSAAAVIDYATKTILSNCRHSQIPIHCKTRGIVPRTAADLHVEILPKIIQKSLEESSCTLDDITAIGVARGPGLAFSLKAGVEEAVRLSTKQRIPLFGVHHMVIYRMQVCHLQAAHALIVRLTSDESPKFPFLALLISGGHTLIAKANSCVNFEVIGSTLDDSIGDALDKACNFLNIAWDQTKGAASALEKVALRGNPHKYPFTLPFSSKDTKTNYSMSFSGLKTALKTRIKCEKSVEDEQTLSDLAASFQYACFEHVLRRLEKYVMNNTESFPRQLVVSGGVASNTFFRKK